MSTEEFSMNRARRVFTAEFKINAVNLVLNEHRKPAEVARSLNCQATRELPPLNDTVLPPFREVL